MTKAELNKYKDICTPEELEDLIATFNVDDDETLVENTLNDLVKLNKYEKLETEGRLIELPCKVGDTVFEIYRGKIQEYTVISIHLSNCSNLYGWKMKSENGIYSNLNGFEESAIGTKVFLTKSEAEAKLKEMEVEE